MSERLKALADAGVSIWLDDLSRERLKSNNLADLVAESSVVGVTTNPTIFASALAKGEAYDDADRRARRPGLLGRGHDQGADHRRRPQRLRRAGRHLGGHPRGRRPGLDRGRARAGPRRRRHHRPGPGPVEDRRPAEPADQDPGHPGGPAGDHRGDRRGHQRQRHPDLLPAALRGVIDAYLSGLEQAAANGHDLSQIHSVASFFVSRVDTEVRQAARRDRHRRGQGAEEQGRHRQRPAGVRGLRAGVRQRPLGGPGRPGRQQAAAAVGLHRGQGPVAARHPLRDRAGGGRHRQHDAGEDDAGLRRPRRGRRATRSPAAPTRPAR